MSLFKKKFTSQTSQPSSRKVVYPELSLSIFDWVERMGRWRIGVGELKDRIGISESKIRCLNSFCIFRSPLQKNFRIIIF